MSLALDIVSWLLLLAGSFAALTAAVGLVRFPDFFSRTHAVGVLDTAAVGLILVGLALQTGLSLDTVRVLLVLVFILITGPTAAHALARSALHSGVEPSDRERGENQSSGS